jgi:stage II sporulation protein D
MQEQGASRNTAPAACSCSKNKTKVRPFCSSMRAMCSSLVRKATVLLLAYSLLLPIVFGQQQTTETTRPRRTQPVWTPPAAAAPIITTPALTPVAGPEPTIRVALSTDARSAVISTTGHLMNASGGGKTLVALDTSRVRVDPRLLSPLPANRDEAVFRVMVGGAATREEAEANEKDIQKITGEDAHAAYDTETKTWGMFVGGKLSREEAEEFRARLETAGIDATIEGPPQQSAAQQQQAATSTSPVRLTSRPVLPSREVVASSSAGRILNSSAPVSFASDDETTAPVRFNDRPYRGRIEVFTNLRGTLTVVNELGLEDYVRGVVANELSPGGYPAIEALKAQAIAARTYALKNRGQFMAQGFDILPTTRSQVYRGLTSENPLATRAVDETRGIVATYNGEPINALYTSTCGGRTEDSEKIFNEAIPYLRARECAGEGATFDRFLIKTSRPPAELQDDANVLLARDVSVLLTHNFGMLNERVSDAWLSAQATASEVRNWIANVARVAQQPTPPATDDVNRPPAFATALALAVFGESRAGTLLNNADADYLLAVRDVQEVPIENRADLAMLLRDGHLSVYPDATLRPRTPLSRARVLHAIARVLEARNILQLQKANARPTSDGQLILRSSKGKDQPIRVNPDAFLFRYLGERPYAVSSVALVGGEPVTYHLAANGQIDFLEVKPAPNGAAADRFSPFANWTKGLGVAQVQAHLARAAKGIGQIVDLRVASRGASHRVTDLEIVGTSGTAHVRGGRIRSALGLREQLFVIDREYDDDGRVREFIFTGRGWGHGVGMCQVGAYGLAKQGWTAEQIIKTYYTGVDLTRLY